MTVSRRALLSGLLAAPLVVPAERLMKLSGVPLIPIRNTWIKNGIEHEWIEYRLAGTSPPLEDRVPEALRTTDKLVNVSDWKIDYTKWCDANKIKWGSGDTIVTVISPQNAVYDDPPPAKYCALPPTAEYIEEQDIAREIREAPWMGPLRRWRSGPGGGRTEEEYRRILIECGDGYSREQMMEEATRSVPSGQLHIVYPDELKEFNHV